MPDFLPGFSASLEWARPSGKWSSDRKCPDGATGAFPAPPSPKTMHSLCHSSEIHFIKKVKYKNLVLEMAWRLLGPFFQSKSRWEEALTSPKFFSYRMFQVRRRRKSQKTSKLSTNMFILFFFILSNVFDWKECSECYHTNMDHIPCTLHPAASGALDAASIPAPFANGYHDATVFHACEKRKESLICRLQFWRRLFGDFLLFLAPLQNLLVTHVGFFH